LKPSTIAIDGPAASGKSTVGEELAQRLGYLYLDTGAMYRAVTWIGLQRGIRLADEEAITELAQQLHIDVVPTTVEDGRRYTVLADDQDVTWDIRLPEVDANVSLVSTYGGVREAMVDQQRRIARAGRIVMVGRDIGSVVMPDADLKIYLDASVEERARRRWEEMLNRGEEADLEDVLRMMRRRDRIDSGRDISPLTIVPDAVMVDTTNMDIEEVVQELERLVER
jgi:cytidylate kinase